MTAKKTVKVAYDFDTEVKFKLASLKAELRRRGIAATETCILEALVREAKVDAVARAYRRCFPEP
ncbi:MAG TPA: hypothetical protein VGG89_16820 [Candidatus Baltobacteraceae bacterium]|jgi:hypothetical protein